MLRQRLERWLPISPCTVSITPAMAMDKLERLLNLTLLLLESDRPLTIDDVAAKLPEGTYPADSNSFRRAFERDKEDLREMGIPLEVAPLPGGDANVVGYRIHPDQYYLPDLGLTTEELASLQLALAMVDVEDDRGGGDPLDALRKLGGVGDGTGPGATPITDVITTVPLPEVVGDLFRAAIDRRTVGFHYAGVDRQVDPWRLEFQRGHWYLSGYDRVREDERNYRADRIDGAVTLGPRGGFERPARVPGVRLTPWQLGEGRPIEAVIAVDADYEPVARALVGPDASWESTPDGWSVRLEVTDLAALQALVLEMLDHVTLVEPADARAALVAHLEAMLTAGDDR